MDVDTRTDRMPTTRSSVGKRKEATLSELPAKKSRKAPWKAKKAAGE